MEVAIIGGGIGGLTTALALKQANIRFKVYEAAPEIKAVGAGIIMANNAMQAFRNLGIHQEIYQKGNLINAMTIARPDFSPLSRISLIPFEEKYQVQNHAIHRADLHGILSNAIGHQHIETNKRLQHIKKEDKAYVLTFEDGTNVQAGYIIGADGIRSQVRQQLFSENEYRDAGQICWRGVLNFTLPKAYAHEAMEVWGKGKRFGFVQISKDLVYWYAVVDTGLVTDNPNIISLLRDMDPLVTALVKATAEEKIIKGPLYDLKPIDIWSKEDVCLIGDAAHATTPNLGQGACQAIEDAYTLGELAKKYSLTDAFRKYPEIRRKKAHYIVNTSWKIGEVAHWHNPFAIGLRNLVLKYLTPDSVNLKLLDKVFTLENID